MITDQQVRRLVKMRQTKTIYQAADASGMSEKTARKYLKSKKLPSELKKVHSWNTHPDVFEQIWPMISDLLWNNPGLEGKTILDYLERESPEKYKQKYLRTLQRRIKNWRATEGPEKEVIFNQVHRPGERSESYFSHMDEVGVSIQGEHYKHMIYIKYYQCLLICLL